MYTTVTQRCESQSGQGATSESLPALEKLEKDWRNEIVVVQLTDNRDGGPTSKIVLR